MATELERVRLELDPMMFSSANQNRTPGIHLTDVIRDYLLVAAGGQSKYKDNGRTREDLDAYALQGYLWEDAMTRTLVGKVRETNGRAIQAEHYERLPEIAVRIDESQAFFIDPEWPAELAAMLTRGCIITTPDGSIGRLPDKRRLLECKWTTKSANMNPEREKPEWFHQVKGGLVMLSAVWGELIDEVEHHVQFAVGSRWGEPPIYERWRRRYEQQEMWQTWRMAVDHVGVRVAGDDPCGWGRYLETVR